MLRSCDECGRPTANLDGACCCCRERAALARIEPIELDDDVDDREPDFVAIAESRTMARSWIGDRV
jgi:hypothetical protein